MKISFVEIANLFDRLNILIERENAMRKETFESVGDIASEKIVRATPSLVFEASCEFQ